MFSLRKNIDYYDGETFAISQRVDYQVDKAFLTSNTTPPLMHLTDLNDSSLLLHFDAIENNTVQQILEQKFSEFVYSPLFLNQKVKNINANIFNEPTMTQYLLYNGINQRRYHYENELTITPNEAIVFDAILELIIPYNQIGGTRLNTHKFYNFENIDFDLTDENIKLILTPIFNQRVVFPFNCDGKSINDFLHFIFNNHATIKQFFPNIDINTKFSDFFKINNPEKEMVILTKFIDYSIQKYTSAMQDAKVFEYMLEPFSINTTSVNVNLPSSPMFILKEHELSISTFTQILQLMYDKYFNDTDPDFSKFNTIFTDPYLRLINQFLDYFTNQNNITYYQTNIANDYEINTNNRLRFNQYINNFTILNFTKAFTYFTQPQISVVTLVNC
jgi:hypothetical protein